MEQVPHADPTLDLLEVDISYGVVAVAWRCSWNNVPQAWPQDPREVRAGQRGDVRWPLCTSSCCLPLLVAPLGTGRTHLWCGWKWTGAYGTAEGHSAVVACTETAHLVPSNRAEVAVG